MLTEVKMFTVTCDNCGKDVNEGSEFAAWSDSDYAREIAADSNWYMGEDKDYCPKCYSFDEADTIEINSQRTKVK